MNPTNWPTAMAAAFAFLALAGGLTAAATGPDGPARPATEPVGDAAAAPSAMVVTPDDRGYLWAGADSRASGYLWSSSEGWDGATRLGPPTDWRPRNRLGALWGELE